MPAPEIDWSPFLRQLHGFVAARVRDASDAEDLVQLILERALSKTGSTDIGHTAGWLFGIARNAIADHYRARARTLLAAADALDATAEPLGTSEEERAAVLACMEPLLNMLPHDTAQLLRWADMQDRSMQWIASELGITVSATKSRVQRARKEFVQVTRKCCAIDLDARGRVTGLTPRHATDCSACDKERSPNTRNRS